MSEAVPVTFCGRWSPEDKAAMRDYLKHRMEDPFPTSTEAPMSTGSETTAELPCGTKFPHLFSLLSADFDPGDIKTRPAPGGRQLKYITARTVMNRLDDVVGPENWTEEYFPNEKSVMCRLTITLPDGRAVAKMDAGGYAGMADQGDDEKSAFSDAFKRAAVKFGIGRNQVYNDGMAHFHHNGEVVEHRQAEHREPPRQPDRNGTANGHAGGNGSGKVPRTGKAMFAWTKEQEQKHKVGLLKYLNGWAKLMDFPGRMIDWDADQVSQAYDEAIRKIRTLATGADEPHGDAHPHEHDQHREQIRREFGGGADDDMQGY